AVGIVRARRSNASGNKGAAVEFSRHGRLTWFARSPPFAIIAARCWIAALDNAVWNHAMKCQPVVEAFARQLLEVLDMLRRHIGVELDFEFSEVCLDYRNLLVGRNLGLAWGVSRSRRSGWRSRVGRSG